ncbi:PP2C family protein-serine/threonine phosphatase [Paraflavitalea pollutisoli]|uniref:PP2C family protein-serine/threonine phosphatase n=1 Tax=Paraflavitalea pollutisoli TaxID=3034143 RepID=UPI0023EB1AA3|nr:protein phosphatase 2C domain-containing protein [Paraflavitalea sp. H1-2-19X]
MKNILINGTTDPGKRRKENQDAFIARQLWNSDNALVAVIDGVGGYTGGEKAAAIAKESIAQYMEHPKGDTLTMLREALIYANNRIVEERKKDQLISEMCCVLTAVVADAAKQQVYYAHVGDTRLYRYRNGLLQKLTKDHSFVGIREDAGEMTEQEAMSHPQRNQILREVGSTLHRLDDEDFMDYGSEALLPGDQLLLCSDGLTDMITSRQITTILGTTQALPHKVNSLVALANEMGGNDNITVVLLKRKAPAKKQVTVTAPAIQAHDAKPHSQATQAAQEETQSAEVIQPVRSTFRRNIYIAGITVAVLAGMGWFMAPPRPIDVAPPRILPIDSIKTAGAAVRVNNTAVPGPVEEKTDTLKISTSKSWNYIRQYADSVGRTLVILPADKNKTRFAAITINERSAKPGDTILLKNLRLAQFETGFSVQVPVMLKTDNLSFENIKYPFQNLVKADSSHPSLLIMHNIKR